MGRRRAPTAVALAALIAAALAALLAPAAAPGHAQLESTSPPRGAVVEPQPDAVVFRFDEAVEASAGAARVYDASGERVEEGESYHPGGDERAIAVDLRPELPDGSYTATYRVLSADGHVITSGIVFSVGRAGRAPSRTVAELTAEVGTGAVTDVAFGLARGLQYAAMALAIGGVFFALVVWLPALASLSRPGPGGARWGAARAAFMRRLSALLGAAVATGAVTAAAAVVLEGAETAGVPAFSALAEPLLRESLGTRSGGAWGMAIVAWLALGALAVALRRARRPGREAALLATAAAPAAFLALVPALSGHAGVQSPVAVLLAANVAHVAAMGVWLGGLATLLAAVPRGSRELDPQDRSRLLAALLGRFSQVALLAVAAILVTGLVQAYVYVREPAALLESGYGRAVLAKLLLLAAVVGLGAHNRLRSLPRLRRVAAGGEPPGRAGLVLRRALRAEVALLVVVLGATAALASYAPPISAQPGPFSTREEIGPALFEMTVEPAMVGPNEVHVYLFDARTGAPFRRARELGLTATLPEERISLPLRPQEAGPGHWVVPGTLFGSADDWDLDVVVRVSAFDQLERTIAVPIR